MPISIPMSFRFYIILITITRTDLITFLVRLGLVSNVFPYGNYDSGQNTKIL